MGDNPNTGYLKILGNLCLDNGGALHTYLCDTNNANQIWHVTGIAAHANNTYMGAISELNAHLARIQVDMHESNEQFNVSLARVHDEMQNATEQFKQALDEGV